MKNKNIFETPDIDANRYIKKGLVILFLVFVIMGGWAYFAKIDTGVPLPGQVVVQTSKKIIQHLEGGIVKRIYVKDGDIVKKRDKLIEFDNIKAKSQLITLEAQYYEAIVLADRLKAENLKYNKIRFSKELYKLNPKKREKLFSAQIEIFRNEKSSLEKQKQISLQQIDSLKQQIENLMDTVKTKENLLQSYMDEAKEQQSLYDEHLIDKRKLREVKRKIKSLESDILTLKTNISRAKIQILETKTKFLLTKEDFYRKVKNTLRETKISIESTRAKMTEVKDRLSRTIIKAPVDGTVLGLKVHTIGAVISPGKPIMEIVPSNSKLIIEARLSPVYIDYVKVGLKANMTFPAFQLKGRFIKNIEGKVIFVAADSTIDRKGRSFYLVKLVVDKKGEDTLKNANLTILAGMPASVVIKVGKQTMFEYILKPMTIMLDRAFLEE